MKFINRKHMMALVCLVISAAGTASAQKIDCRLNPYLANSVSEATSGFAHPLGSRGEKKPGYEYAEPTDAIYCNKVYGTKISVFHPGRDINAKAGDGDLGVPVYAIADGIVVFAYLNGAKYSAVVIEHNYRGSLFYSQYGHVQGIKVSCGQVVQRGQQIAEIGKNGATSAHLHFEIRNASHPDPTNGTYFCQSCSNTPCLKDLSFVMARYEDPIRFIADHGPYSSEQAVLQVGFAPNPVPAEYATCGEGGPPSWGFRITLRETNGVGITMGDFEWEFFDEEGHYISTYTSPVSDFDDFFSSCGYATGVLPPRTSVCGDVCVHLGGRNAGFTRLTFRGTDANGHSLSFRSGFVTLSPGNFKYEEQALPESFVAPCVSPR